VKALAVHLLERLPCEEGGEVGGELGSDLDAVDEVLVEEGNRCLEVRAGGGADDGEDAGEESSDVEAAKSRESVLLKKPASRHLTK
jgi:hypothetical protein